MELKTHCDKEIICSANLVFYLFFPNSFNKLKKNEHSYKILYVYDETRRMTKLTHRYLDTVNSEIYAIILFPQIALALKDISKSRQLIQS